MRSTGKSPDDLLTVGLAGAILRRQGAAARGTLRWLRVLVVPYRGGCRGRRFGPVGELLVVLVVDVVHDLGFVLFDGNTTGTNAV